jgi:fido (protein-threonine AMPylation protein)
MNETLNTRQAALYSALQGADKPLSRQELEALIAAQFPVSKPTLIRDLNILKSHSLIGANELGPATTYYAGENELLQYIVLDSYFAKDSSSRQIDESSNEYFIGLLERTSLLNETDKAVIVRLQAEFSEKIEKINPALYKKEVERWSIELAWKSAQIEGNTYSLLETENLLKNNIPSSNHTQSETQMILNHKTALNFIFNNTNRFVNLELDSILQVHSLLMDNMGVTDGIRDGVVRITGTNYVPVSSATQILNDLERVIMLVNTKENPVEKALVLSGMIAYLQPFFDGNKRTARLMGNAILLAYNYAALSYRMADEIEYKKAVLLIDEKHNFYWYKQLFLEQYDYSVQQYF